MKLWKLAKRYPHRVLSVLDILFVLCPAVYSFPFAHYLAESKELEFFTSWWDLLLLLFALVIILKIRLTSDARMSTAEQHVRQLLEIAVKTLTFAHKGKQLEIRALCHLYNARTKMLDCYAFWGYNWHHDGAKPIPCEHELSRKFVIVRAFKDKDIKQENVPDDAVKGMPLEIWPDLKCVLAAAIRDYAEADSDTQVLGVINFDANRTLEQAHFDGAQAREICRLFAQAI